MVKPLSVAAFSLIFLSGCSLPGLGGGSEGSIFKSSDAGETFEPKVAINEETSIQSADVFSAVICPNNPDRLYIGTEANGIFRTKNGGDQWEAVTFPPEKIYGLTLDPENCDRLYASGSYLGVGKIYVTENGGDEWREIYTEPGPGSVITALALHPVDRNVLYAGTSEGVVIKSTDSGETWKNVVMASAPVTQILYEPSQRELVVLALFKKGVAISTDSGNSFEEFVSSDVFSQGYRSLDAERPETPGDLFTFAPDPNRPGYYLAGAGNGLFRSNDFGRTWEAVPTIESSNRFPIRSVAVNPRNSNEIVYVAGNAFYKSIDGGIKWATTNLTIERGVSRILYHPAEANIIYLTLRAF